MHLTRIGYWRSDSDVTLPDPSDWIDPSWDTDEQAVVTGCLICGTVARSYMGYAACRICGHPNGDMEFSDGNTYGQKVSATTWSSTACDSLDPHSQIRRNERSVECCRVVRSLQLQASRLRAVATGPPYRHRSPYILHTSL